MSATKVIGYFAYQSRTELYCDGDALVVAGSHDAMKHLLTVAAVANSASYTITKARFGEVLDGITRGGAYAFDAEAYGRYETAAKAMGIPCSGYDFSTSTPEEIKLVTISIKR